MSPHRFKLRDRILTLTPDLSVGFLYILSGLALRNGSRPTGRVGALGPFLSVILGELVVDDKLFAGRVVDIAFRIQRASCI